MECHRKVHDEKINIKGEYPDFEIIHTFLETMYISNRIKLPLKGILLIGY